MASESPLTGSTVDSSEVYTLHNQPFSLFSMMVRFTYVLGRGSADSTTNGVHLEYKLVDHQRDENLAEDYLMKINPKGQVRPASKRTIRGNHAHIPLGSGIDGPQALSPFDRQR